MSVMTLKELSEHPERVSEDDLQAYLKSIRLLEKMGKQIEPLINGVTLESGRTKEEIAYSYYEESMLMAAILEAFVTALELEFSYINKFVFNYTDKAMFWDMPVTTYYRCITKLCAIGLLELKKEYEFNPSFTITEDGLAALRQQTYANLAQTALFNLKTQQLNDKTLALSKRAVWQNWMMLIVAIASAVAAFVSVIVAMKG